MFGKPDTYIEQNIWETCTAKVGVLPVISGRTTVWQIQKHSTIDTDIGLTSACLFSGSIKQLSQAALNSMKTRDRNFGYPEKWIASMSHLYNRTQQHLIAYTTWLKYPLMFSFRGLKEKKIQSKVANINAMVRYMFSGWGWTQKYFQFGLKP